MKKELLTATAISLLITLPIASSGTGIPVIDVSAIAQAIKQGLTQIQMYTTQLSQLQYAIGSYKNQLLNTVGIAQSAQIWRDAQQSISGVMGTVSMFRSGAGVTGYLDQFRDVNYWLDTPVTNQNQYQSSNYWSTAQKTANDQMVAEISQQETQIQQDAQALQRLQSQAGTTAGQKESLDVANEMAGLQEKQLLEIRALLVSEQQALATRNGSVATNEAQLQANTQNFLNMNQGISQPHTGWSPVIQ